MRSSLLTSVALVVVVLFLGCYASSDSSNAAAGSAAQDLSASPSQTGANEAADAGKDSEAAPGAEQSDPAFEAARKNDPALQKAKAARSEPLRILVIGAHPADIFDQSGGTMAHHVERGDWVGCAVLTHGGRVHDKVVTDQMFHQKEIPDAETMTKIIAQRADVKTKEILRACAILGVRRENVYFLGADDAVLLVNEPMIRQLARLIRKLRPDVVITHYPLEDAGVASQHATTGKIVMHAIQFARGVDPGDKTPPCKVTQVFFFGIGAAAPRTNLWGAQGGFFNNIFIDITDVAAKKVACLDAVDSQGYGGAYARKRIEFSDAAFGSRVKVPYAEGFIIMNSTTHYYLPVSEIDLAHSKASDHEAISRSSFRIDTSTPDSPTKNAVPR
ncbi:MAG TPA: PIG-L deacetylase family protein [Thermoguttaceae bacterium]|nr:PIG-L deacetylase family protein [Thermoguttaceae bacterium]